MLSMVVWMLTIAASAAGMVLSAALVQPYVHMAIAAAVAVLVAFLAVREASEAQARDVGAAMLASIHARYMGLVWAWGALVLILTYPMILQWRESYTFFIAFMVAAGLCLFFSATLKKDAATGEDDPTMLVLSRYLAWGQLVAMLATMVGLILDGKMTRFRNPRYTDWAANDVFFFGALALVAISWSAVRSTTRTVAR